jgi:hypothetical protein
MCGFVYDSLPRIERDGIGSVRVTQTVEAVRQQCPEARDTVNRFGEAALVIHSFGSSILIEGELPAPDARARAGGLIQAIVVFGGRLKTPEGMGSGSSLGELTNAYGSEILFLTCRRQLAQAIFMTRPTLHFIFRECQTDGERRRSVWPRTSAVVGVAIEVPA